MARNMEMIFMACAMGAVSMRACSKQMRLKSENSELACELDYEQQAQKNLEAKLSEIKYEIVECRQKIEELGVTCLERDEVESVLKTCAFEDFLESESF